MLINYLDYETNKSGLDIKFTFRVTTDFQYFDDLVKEFKDRNRFTYKTIGSSITVSSKTDQYTEYSFSALVEYNFITTSTLELLRSIHFSISDLIFKQKYNSTVLLYKCIKVLDLFVIYIEKKD